MLLPECGRWRREAIWGYRRFDLKIKINKPRIKEEKKKREGIRLFVKRGI